MKLVLLFKLDSSCGSMDPFPVSSGRMLRLLWMILCTCLKGVNELWLTKDTQDITAILMYHGNTLTMCSSRRGRGLSEQGMKQSTGSSKYSGSSRTNSVIPSRNIVFVFMLLLTLYNSNSRANQHGRLGTMTGFTTTSFVAVFVVCFILV
jgi:hypothetical protein